MDDIETLENDRFELLSAYLDGETTATERKQVETWLENDSDFNHCYQQLLQMQRGMQSLPIPATVPVEETIEQVMARIEHKPKLAVWAMVGTAAAVTVAAITGLFSNGGSLIPQTAQNPDGQSNPTIAANNPQLDNLKPSDLLIAIDRSPVDIPATSPLSNQEAP